MGVRDLVEQVIHATTVVPRLGSAALRAGTGPAGAVQVLRISEAALRAAATHGSGVPGRSNAMRHFIWQALLTARFDRATAQALAEAQEAGTPSLHDSRSDQHNNSVGQEYGEAHAPGLRAGSIGEALALLVPVALAKWESAELVWVRKR